MDFWDATRVMIRRWYVAVPLLLLTFGATAYTATAVKPDFVLTSYVQLIPAPTTPDRTGQESRVPSNPWTQLGLEALSQAANYATVDQTFLDTLHEGGYSTSFTITVGDPVAGATIEVVGNTRQQVVTTTDMVIKRYSDSAKALQAQYGVQPKEMISTQRLDQGENLKRPGGKVKRAILAVAGTGFLFAAAATIAFDAVVRRRRARAEAAAAAAENDADRPSEVHSGGHNGHARAAVGVSRQRVDPDGHRSVGSATGPKSSTEYGTRVGAVDGSRSGAGDRVGERSGQVEELSIDATIVLPQVDLPQADLPQVDMPRVDMPQVDREWAQGDKGGSRR